MNVTSECTEWMYRMDVPKIHTIMNEDCKTQTAHLTKQYKAYNGRRPRI